MSQAEGAKKAVQKGLNELEGSGVPVTAFITYFVTFIIGLALVVSNLVYSMATVCAFVNDHPVASYAVSTVGSWWTYLMTFGAVDVPDEIVTFCETFEEVSSHEGVVFAPTLGAGIGGGFHPLTKDIAEDLGYNKEQTESDTQTDNPNPVVPVDQRYNDAGGCDALIKFTPPAGTTISGNTVAKGRVFFIEKLENALADWHEKHPEIAITITELFRTPSYEAQIAKSNPLAKGVKFSAHSAGIAFDFGYRALGCTSAAPKSSQYYSDVAKPLGALPANCQEFIRHMQSAGFYWGGNFKDNLHFDLANPGAPPACAQGASDRVNINKNCAVSCG